MRSRSGSATRARAQALADRLVFGRRANPNLVLSQISQLVAASGSTAQVLGRLLELLAGARGAHAAAIYVTAGERSQLVAGWPAKSRDVAGQSFPITHQGERLGDLSVERPEAPTPAEVRLLTDVASQAGLLLRNLRLNADLEARVEELAESPRRIVAAQDAERRRLERDIHDGVQQQVVALMAKLRLAGNQAGRRSELAAKTLDEVQADAGRLLDDLRELASGIHGAADRRRRGGRAGRRLIAARPTALLRMWCAHRIALTSPEAANGPLGRQEL